ncbi:hypothetical protein GGR56DRAFT_24435 [Xylariaceae sp. FL0804]|nr:hypothetical protein GGR56DRAFT_24435 [Xylariaceae sp. FL0804]
MVTRESRSDEGSVDANGPPRTDVQSTQRQPWQTTDSELNADGVWDAPSRATDPAPRGNVPDLLRPGVVSQGPGYDQDEENPWGDANKPVLFQSASETTSAKVEDVPRALRPGPERAGTNPFKRKPIQPSSTQTDATQSSAVAPETPSPMPNGAMSQLQINEPEQNTNPWQPALEASSSTGATPPPPLLAEQDLGKDIWDSGTSPRYPAAVPASNSPAMLSVQSTGDSHPWDENPANPSLPSLPERSPEAEEFKIDQHAWDDLGSNSKGKQRAAPPSQVPDGWNLIDYEAMPEARPTLSRQSTWENFEDADEERPKEEQPAAAEGEAPIPPPRTSAAVPPPQPPRQSDEIPPPQPPRPSDPIPPPQPPRPETPSAANRTETYQIKNINWFDSKAQSNPRKSPILIQNANGPCPLVALVNALTLSTPSEQPSSNLVETLRSREQISLNFLLEAVFDELMTSRHTHTGTSLPDMSELYAFLKGLHTGMNVNPRFIPSAEDSNSRSTDAPGTFENTKDMKLYATFSVPLIHGWLPPNRDPAFDALRRQASSYEDASSVMFREEELEDKLSNSADGLTEQEQQLYQDIITIRHFLETSATQLTPWGLDVVTNAIKPGDIVILFRNDHFSTLYRHPKTRQLFTLVTDAGYLTHDEIVWESLVDVRGERAEFFSGDFRVVGGNQQHRTDSAPSNRYNETQGSTSADTGAGWQTVQSRRSRNNGQGETSHGPPQSPAHEQEDRDLALALQLQEEEDERHRAEQVARRRESRLSEQFIEQQGRRGNSSGLQPSASRGGGGASPGVAAARTSSATQQGSRPAQQVVRPLVPPANRTHRPADDDVDEAPPSYEQASKATPYVPPAGHPSHPGSSAGSSRSPRRGAPPRRQSGAATTTAAAAAAGPSTPNGRARPGGVPVAAGAAASAVPPAGAGTAAKERDCVVM